MMVSSGGRGKGAAGMIAVFRDTAVVDVVAIAASSLAEEERCAVSNVGTALADSGSGE
jgi:hypothetical protein